MNMSNTVCAYSPVKHNIINFFKLNTSMCIHRNISTVITNLLQLNKVDIYKSAFRLIKFDIFYHTIFVENLSK